MFQLTLFSFLVRIFIGQVPLKPNVTHGKYADLKQLEGEILAMVSVRAGVVVVLLVQLGQAATRLSGLGWALLIAEHPGVVGASKASQASKGC